MIIFYILFIALCYISTLKNINDTIMNMKGIVYQSGRLEFNITNEMIFVLKIVSISLLI